MPSCRGWSRRDVLWTHARKGTGAGSAGVCSETTTAATVTASFDAADRITGSSNNTAGAYTYDVMGRTLTVPGSDANGTSTHTTAIGRLTVGYYGNDLVAAQTQGAGDNRQAATFDLDVQQGRFAGQTTQPGPDTAVVETPSPTTTTTVQIARVGPTPTSADPPKAHPGSRTWRGPTATSRPLSTRPARSACN